MHRIISKGWSQACNSWMTGLVKLHDWSSHCAVYGSPSTKLGHTCIASYLRVGHKSATVGAEKEKEEEKKRKKLPRVFLRNRSLQSHSCG